MNVEGQTGEDAEENWWVKQMKEKEIRRRKGGVGRQMKKGKEIFILGKGAKYNWRGSKVEQDGNKQRRMRKG